MGYDRGLTVFHLDFLNQMEFHLVHKIERKTVTTIISHSMRKNTEKLSHGRFEKDYKSQKTPRNPSRSKRWREPIVAREVIQCPAAIRHNGVC